LILFSAFLCLCILCKVLQSSYDFCLFIFRQVANGILLVMGRAVLMRYVQYWYRACHVHRLLLVDCLIYRKQFSTTRIVTETSGIPQHNLHGPNVFGVWISLSLFRWDEERGVGTKRCSLFSLRRWILFKISVTILTIYNYQIQNFGDQIKKASLYGNVDMHTFSQIVIWN
jgi:hypothetical protein